MKKNILLHFKSIIKIIYDWARPHCIKCGKRCFPHHHCDLCGCICKDNYIVFLKDNYIQYGKNDLKIIQSEWVCKQCSDERELTICAKTHNVFLKAENQMCRFRCSQFLQNLDPYHPSSQISGNLSPQGYKIIEGEHQELQSRLHCWAGCTKKEFLLGHRIKKEIKLIRTIEAHGDPASVEYELKWHCLQIGGNGLIKFFSDKHIKYHEEEYVAGYSHKGNPYYQTRRWTTAYFSGHAVAVIAELKASSSNSQKTENSKYDKSPLQREGAYWRILGLSGDISKEDIRVAYRKAINEYHPDKVACLGPELRVLAEKKSKEINEAYQFLKKQYGL